MAESAAHSMDIPASPTGSCTGTNQFDSLSETLGSMTEFVSFSLHPTNADILLGGTQDNGSPTASSATTSTVWQNALGGDGGFNAINPSNPNEWFAANPYLTILKCELGTACNDAGFVEIVSPANRGGNEGAAYLPTFSIPRIRAKYWWALPPTGKSVPAEPLHCSSAMTSTRSAQAYAPAGDQPGNRTGGGQSVL